MIRPIVVKPQTAKFLWHRQLASGRTEEPLVPWDTTWLAYDPEQTSDDAPPKGDYVSLGFQGLASKRKVDHDDHPSLHRYSRKAPLAAPEQGVSVDKRGQLMVTSRSHAEQECRTALILSNASTRLTVADFRRLLPEGGRNGDHGFQGLLLRPVTAKFEADQHLEAAIPGRDPGSFDRVPYWIVLFRTPFQAASYQSRMRWYHRNASKNSPVDPLQAALIPHRGLPPPPGYIDRETGEDVWQRLHEYCLLFPSQDFSVTALLPKFPLSVHETILEYERWNDLDGVRSWTVLVRVKGGDVGEEDICRFLEDDGKAQSRAWDVMYHDFETRSMDDLSTHTAQKAVFTVGTRRVPGEGSPSFGIKFRSEGDAMRFWRTWHRRPFPLLAQNASAPDIYAPYLHVELTW